jgi:hypothetical protein
MAVEGIAPIRDTSTPTQSPAAFPYGELPPEKAAELQQLAESIRGLGRKQIDAMIEIGRKLAKAQEELEHGQFIPWITAEFDMSHRTALNYIHLAKLAADKPEIISDLPPTAGYLIAAPGTPSAARQAVADRIRAGEALKVDDVKKIVRAAKEEIVQAKRAELNERRKAKLNPESGKAAKRRLKDAEREEAQREREARERAERCQRAGVMLRQGLGEDLSAFLELVDCKDSSPLLDGELLEQLR